VIGPNLTATGLAAILTFAFVMLVDRNVRPATLGAAAFLGLTWCATTIAAVFGQPPDSMLWSQICDAVLAVFLLGSLRHERARWKVCLMILLAIQALTNLAYQYLWQHPIAFNTRVLVLNMTFFAQLICVLSPGVWDVFQTYHKRRTRMDSIGGPSELD
jgi:hypothetical protein